VDGHDVLVGDRGGGAGIVLGVGAPELAEAPGSLGGAGAVDCSTVGGIAWFR
jgi:hypothetical protein